MTKVQTVTLIVLSTVTAGCNLDSHDINESQKLDNELSSLIDTKQIVPVEIPHNNPKIQSKLAQLGKQLFFSQSLSGDMDTACASCHHPNLGGADAIPLSIGVAALDPQLLGPGRLHDANALHHDGGPTIPRNSPTTFNISLIKNFLFHDGRVENNGTDVQLDGLDGQIRTPDVAINENDLNAGSSLSQAQSRFPVTSMEEMRGFNFASDLDNDGLRAALEERLQGKTNELSHNNWLEAFRYAFNDGQGSADNLVTYDNISMALATYEQSQLFIDNPWFEYLAGNKNAITDSAKRGALLFYRTTSEGGFNCASCHSSGLFSDERFHVIAIPQVGRGKGDGLHSDDDFGRFRETNEAVDKYAFRTPSLLNVTQTGPWGHSGAYNTLSDVIKHHLQPKEMILNYVPDDIQPGIQITNWYENTSNAYAQLEALQASGKSKLQIIEYSEVQITDVIEFLSSLTDPCIMSKSCMQLWVPNSAELDPDGTRLIAIDAHGQEI